MAAAEKAASAKTETASTTKPAQGTTAPASKPETEMPAAGASILDSEPETEPEHVDVPPPPAASSAATSAQKAEEPKPEEPAAEQKPAEAETKVAEAEKQDQHAATPAEQPPAEATPKPEEHAEATPAPAPAEEHAEAEVPKDEARAALEAELPAADSLTAGKQIFHVWLGDKGQDDAARKAFDGDGGAKTRFSPLLDSYALEVRRFDSDTTVFRIYVGPVESLQKAHELCAKIKERDSGQMCRPVIN